jgi:predicted neutral ceramidase superfamily lipid hydrolase
MSFLPHFNFSLGGSNSPVLSHSIILFPSFLFFTFVYFFHSYRSSIPSSILTHEFSQAVTFHPVLYSATNFGRNTQTSLTEIFHVFSQPFQAITSIYIMTLPKSLLSIVLSSVAIYILGYSPCRK